MQDLVLCCCAWLLVPGREAMLVAKYWSCGIVPGRWSRLQSFACVEQHRLCVCTGSCLAVGVSCNALLALSSIAFVFAQDRAWPLESVARLCIALSSLAFVFAPRRMVTLCLAVGASWKALLAMRNIACVFAHGALCISVHQCGRVLQVCLAAIPFFASAQLRCAGLM